MPVSVGDIVQVRAGPRKEPHVAVVLFVSANGQHVLTIAGTSQIWDVPTAETKTVKERTRDYTSLCLSKETHFYSTALHSLPVASILPRLPPRTCPPGLFSTVMKLAIVGAPQVLNSSQQSLWFPVATPVAPAPIPPPVATPTELTETPLGSGQVQGVPQDSEG
jgi:hypothetical protein